MADPVELRVNWELSAAIEEMLCAAGSPVDLITAAQELLQAAAVAIISDGTPADRPRGMPRSAQEVHDIEDTIQATERALWVGQAVQTYALARYAATDDETVCTDTGLRARVEFPAGHEAAYADQDLAPGCD
ncbi:hypothetical protein [Calidifontibacter terrae]